jgi:hypothetical protein
MVRIRSVSPASPAERSDGARPTHAQKPLGETPSTRHIVATGKTALSCATNRNTFIGPVGLRGEEGRGFFQDHAAWMPQA